MKTPTVIIFLLNSISPCPGWVNKNPIICMEKSCCINVSKVIKYRIITMHLPNLL